MSQNDLPVQFSQVPYHLQEWHLYCSDSFLTKTEFLPFGNLSNAGWYLLVSEIIYMNIYIKKINVNEQSLQEKESDAKNIKLWTLEVHYFKVHRVRIILRFIECAHSKSERNSMTGMQTQFCSPAL